MSRSSASPKCSPQKQNPTVDSFSAFALEFSWSVTVCFLSSFSMIMLSLLTSRLMFPWFFSSLFSSVVLRSRVMDFLTQA